MLTYTTAELRDGTGWKRGQRFVRADDADLLNTLWAARACIKEGVHEDRYWRAETLNRIEEELKSIDPYYDERIAEYRGDEV